MNPPVALANACLMSMVGSSEFSGKLTSSPLGMTARSRVELDAERPQVVGGQVAVHDRHRGTTTSATAFAPGKVEQAFLHPLQMVRLEK